MLLQQHHQQPTDDTDFINDFPPGLVGEGRPARKKNRKIPKSGWEGGKKFKINYCYNNNNNNNSQPLGRPIFNITINITN